jgi:DNA-binding response OmpR family regulator
MHTHIGALHAAASKLGGPEPLARHLRVPLADLQRWTSAAAAVPALCFLRAVDVMLADGEPLQKLRQAAGDGRLHLDMGTRRAYVQGQHVALPLTEWAVLESLSARQGQAVSREQLRRELALWTGRKLADAIQMYVFRLRLKLEPLGLRIRTVPRTGYLLDAAVQ